MLGLSLPVSTEKISNSTEKRPPYICRQLYHYLYFLSTAGIGCIARVFACYYRNFNVGYS
jgi:hypothetical protein